MSEIYQEIPEEVKSWSAKVGESIEEEAEPAINLMEKMDALYYAAGAVTSESKFGRSSKDILGRERPLFLRAKRAELYKKVRAIIPENKQGRKDVIHEAKLRDEIAEQYLNQKDLRITMPEYGEIGARVVDIEPPEELQTPEIKNKPPIFLIPGLGNDVDCMNTMVNEIAMQGRRAVIVGYPESFMGQATAAFADAVENDDGIAPHVAFYRAALDTLFPNNQPVEMWGYSTGAPIVSGILKQHAYQERTENAVLLCPAASVDQTVKSQQQGAMKDIAFMKRLGRGAYLNFTAGKKGSIKSEQTTLRERIFGSMFNKITHANTDWQGARVREGGSIVVVSAEKDQITKSAQKNEEFRQHPQMRVLELKNGYHVTPQVDADTVIPKIFAEQQAQ